MSDTFITCLAIGVAAVLLFIFPVITVANRNDDIAQLAVETATIQFVDKVRNTGALTSFDFDSYEEELASTGNSFSIELEHQKQSDTIGKKNSWSSSSVIGEMAYTSEYTTQILDKLDTDGKYILKKGDIFSASCKNTNSTLAQTLRNGFYSIVGKEASTIGAQHAGLVQSNGNKN